MVILLASTAGSAPNMPKCEPTTAQPLTSWRVFPLCRRMFCLGAVSEFVEREAPAQVLRSERADRVDAGRDAGLERRVLVVVRQLKRDGLNLARGYVAQLAEDAAFFLRRLDATDAGLEASSSLISSVAFCQTATADSQGAHDAPRRKRFLGATRQVRIIPLGWRPSMRLPSQTLRTCLRSAASGASTSTTISATCQGPASASLACNGSVHFGPCKREVNDAQAKFCRNWPEKGQLLCSARAITS